ncbi:MAG TPA: hypothetical protein VGI14_06280 [Casimicrobiaceae bacterium]
MALAFRLDRDNAVLLDGAGCRFDPAARRWSSTPDAAAGRGLESVDVVEAVAWLQRESDDRLRVPIGVIGPRDATPRQLAAALEVGEWLARCGLTLVCGGRHGVMQAVCEGSARNGGVSIGILPDTDASLANPYVTVPIASGIGEARNAIIARAAFCIVAVGNSHGTLSEVALGRHFGKTVIGLEGAADVDGVVHVGSPRAAVEAVACLVLGLAPDSILA